MSARVLLAERSPTVRRVTAATLRERGHICITLEDPEEVIERARRHAPDLFLIDQHLGGRGGLALLRRLRAIDNLAQVPTVLLAARARDIDDTLARELGADVIQKPFAPEALLAVAQHALDSEAVASTTPVDVEGPSPDVERREAAAAIRARLAQTLSSALAPLTRGATAEGLADTLRAGLEDHALLSLIDELADGLPGTGASASLSARLEDVALGEVLQMLQHERQTGVLSVGDGRRRAHICLRDGMVDLATARGISSELRLGRYLVEDGAIEARELEELLTRRGGSGHLMGLLLVKLGYVTAEDVRAALIRQSSEILYETLRWASGTCQFRRFDRRPEADQARLGLPVGAILMEGLRRVDEWRLIEEQLPGFDVRLRPSADALAGVGSDALSAEDREVLDVLGAESSVGEVVAASGHAAFDTCKILFRLVTSGLVRRV
ncbi:MAG: response regulator [Deltaproteobacteria bacterium]|nr:response regulator [Deltaproteobacteria bacterium]